MIRLKSNPLYLQLYLLLAFFSFETVLPVAVLYIMMLQIFNFVFLEFLINVLPFQRTIYITRDHQEHKKILSNQFWGGEALYSRALFRVLLLDRVLLADKAFCFNSLLLSK